MNFLNINNALILAASPLSPCPKPTYLSFNLTTSNLPGGIKDMSKLLKTSLIVFSILSIFGVKVAYVQMEANVL